MKDIFKNEKYMPVLGLVCAFGWSLAYPFIKIGYAEFGINDIPGKIFFAGIRFLLAGLLVVIFTKGRLDINKRSDYRWLVLMALVNTALHYTFAYIGLGYNASARSTILDSMGSLYRDQTIKLMPTIQVNAVDSTGAGDLYHGAFTYAISKKLPITKAVQIATVAGGISVTKIGGRNSVATKEEMRKYIHDFE